MAVSYYSPLPASIRDAVTFKEASGLLRRTGHPASVTTLQRWVEEAGAETERVNRTDYVSFTVILQIHAAKVRMRDN